MKSKLLVLLFLAGLVAGMASLVQAPRRLSMGSRDRRPPEAGGQTVK